MHNDTFLKKYFSFLFAGILLITFFTSVLPVNGEEAVYSKIFRLHVLANSDTEEDQALKLKVRDKILEKLQIIYEESTPENSDNAAMLAASNSEVLSAAAKEVIVENGYDYNVQIVVCNEQYPTREYENITLPAGEYKSLQAKIGKAEGKNWWCVLFPTLCLATATEYKSPTYIYEENGEKLAQAGFTPEEIRIITDSESPDIKIKFRVLEVLEELFNKD